MYMCMPWSFDWYLIRMSVISGVLGMGVVMHVLRLLDEWCVVLLGASRGECAGDGWGKYRLC